MVTIFYYAILLAILHFIYESIVLPTLRLKLRFKLFELRDSLYRMAIEDKINSNDKNFEHIEKSIDNTIRHLPYMTFSTVYEAGVFYKNNPEIKKEVEKKIDAIENIKNEALKNIHHKCIQYSINSLLLNSASWIIYVLPILIIYKILKSLGLSIFKIGKTIQSLTVTPQHQFEKLVLDRTIYC